MAQADAGRRLVDFLAASASAADEGLDNVIFVEDNWGRGRGRRSGRGGEGPTVDEVRGADKNGRG